MSDAPVSIPVWLKIILGLLPIPLWIKAVLEVAYELYMIIPWFHKHGALMELRDAVRQAKSAQSTKPVEEWTNRWQQFTAPSLVH